MKKGDLELGSPLKFYNGSITLRFSQRDHAYYKEVCGDLLPVAGVTKTCQIIDKSVVLINWACKMFEQRLLQIMPFSEDFDGKFIESVSWTKFEEIVANAKKTHKDILKDAADVGAEAHRWLEDSIRWAIAHNHGVVEKLTDEVPSDERAVNCGNAALKWMLEHEVVWVKTESVIYSRKHDYAGTIDGLAKVDGILSIVDWKSSNAFREEFCLQTAAYQQAAIEECGLDIRNRWILRLGKEDGEFEPWHLGPETIEDDFEAFRLCLTLKKLYAKIEERMKMKKKARKPKNGKS